MRILLLAHAFNGLTQRLHAELRAAGHEVSVELDIADSVTEEAVALWQPELVIAPFLKRRIPESVWSTRVCLVLHPGPPGDRGPSALDWAVLKGEARWGVTVLQATGDYDAGPVWAWAPFAMRDASKASLYRHEVNRCAVQAVLEAVGHFVRGSHRPSSWPALPPVVARWQPAMRQADRAVDWARDDTATALRKIRSADGHPGVADRLFGVECRLFDAHAATAATVARACEGAPGEVVARRGPAVLRRTVDGGLWIAHVRVPLPDGQQSLKRAATSALAQQVSALPELAVPLQRSDDEWDELRYRESGTAGSRVGWLRFDFHNGAMSVRQCERLRDALRELRGRAMRVLVLEGGADFFSNGIHLHEIEAASHEAGNSAADASWCNIQAIDDVALEILTMTDRITVAAMRGNAAAGGCFLALAADEVWAHEGVVLNPHYKNMGNLYGSEYWTYTLPRRVGEAQAQRIMQGRLPMSAREAAAIGLIDECFGIDAQAFDAEVAARAEALAMSAGLDDQIAAKARRRAEDEARKPLARYREDELARMQRNFYGFDPSYHVARHHFVHRKPQAWTPRHLTLHR